MQGGEVLNVSSQGMQSEREIIVVIGKRKLYDSQCIEALKSNVFDVVTSESREMEKRNGGWRGLAGMQKTLEQTSQATLMFSLNTNFYYRT